MEVNVVLDASDNEDGLYWSRCGHPGLELMKSLFFRVNNDELASGEAI